MKKVISYTLPIFVIFLAAFIFFWKFFLKGLIPIPADITVGMYHPWLDYKWGYIVGVPVKNSLLSDVVSQIYPFRTLAMSLVKQGITPLWNPLMFGGYPLLANPQVGLFNPTNIFYLFLSFPKAWGLQVVFQPFLAGIFTYLFLHSLKLGKIASLLGCLIYAFSGFIMIWLEWNVHGFVVAFLPLCLYLVNEYYLFGRSWAGPMLSIGLCLQIFSGYPQVVFYSISVLIVYVLIMFGFRQKKNVFLIVWLFLGVALSAIQLLPTMELFSLSQRKLETLENGSSFLPWQYLLSLFAPDYFGNITTGNFWGKGDYTANIGYSGIASLILAVISFREGKRSKTIAFFWLLLILSLLLALPTPLAIFVNNLKIIGLQSASMGRILFVTNLSIAVLAAFSFDLLQKEDFKTKNIKSAFFGLMVIGGVFLGTFLANKIFLSSAINSNDRFLQEVVESWSRNLRVGMKNLILPGLIASSVIFLLWISSFRLKLLKKASLFLIFLITIGELFRFGWKFNPFTDQKLIFPETPAISFLKNQKGIFRVDGGDAIPMNMLMPYGLESFSAYDPLYPLRTAQYLSLSDNGSIKNPKSRYGQFDKYTSRLLDLANVCYVYSVKKDKDGKDSIFGLPSYKIQFEKYKTVFEDKAVAVLENTFCFPRAKLFYDYEIIKNDSEIAKRLTGVSFDIRRKIILEKETKVMVNNQNKKDEGKIEWTFYRQGKESIKVSSILPSFLFVAESYYPGWKATVDGQETEIFRADFAFKGVFVPPGEHVVEFTYDPFSYKLGRAISLISLWLIFILLMISLRKFLLQKKFKVV